MNRLVPVAILFFGLTLVVPTSGIAQPSAVLTIHDQELTPSPESSPPDRGRGKRIITLAPPGRGKGEGASSWNGTRLLDTVPQPAQIPVPPSDFTKPVYKPHGAIAPRARIFGTTRGRVDDGPVVLALVPDHVGYTTSRQPTLFWYLSKATSLPITLTLIDTRSIKPILYVKLGQPAQPGVQMVRLKDYALSLEEAVQYRWFVSLVVDPNSPSRDVVTGGVVEYLDPKVVTLDGASACQDRQDIVCRYAEAGLWYDALAAASDQITAAPTDKLLRKKRASLLQQVDLNEPAEWDLRQAIPN